MLARLTVPHLDANILDVTVTAWHKTVGDRVAKGDVVAELTTDKATFEYEATASGTLLAIFAAPKSVVPSGYILAVLGEPGEADAEAAGFNARLMEKYRAEAGGQRPQAGSPQSPGGNPHVEAPPRGAISPHPPSAVHQPASNLSTAPAGRVRATPRARRLAQEQNLDLAAIQAATGAEVVDEAAIQKFLGKG